MAAVTASHLCWCRFSPAHHVGACLLLVKICTSRGDSLSLLKCITHHLAVLTSIAWSPLTFSKSQWVQIFLHGGTHWYTIVSSVLPCQMPFCQTAPLLPSVMQQQHATECMWEGSAPTAIPATSASDNIG